MFGGLAMVGLLVGCETLPPGTEYGPEGTIAYSVPIEATEPGVRIEANGEYMGTTPLTLKIFGDKDGTFHNFGSYTYVIRAFPIQTNQYVQTRVFGTGRHFTHEDRIPPKVFFDMNQPPNSPPPQVSGEPGYYPAYPPPPYYYYPPPVYYGPRVYVRPWYYGYHRGW